MYKKCGRMYVLGVEMIADRLYSFLFAWQRAEKVVNFCYIFLCNSGRVSFVFELEVKCTFDAAHRVEGAGERIGRAWYARRF